MFLSQARTLISNVIYSGLFCVQLRWEVIVCFVDMGGINDHHCLNFLFIMMSYMNRKCMSLCYPWKQLQLVRRNNWNFKSIVPSHEGNLAKVCWDNRWGEYLLHWKLRILTVIEKEYQNLHNFYIKIYMP